MTEPQLTLFKHGVIAARMEATTPGSAWHPFCLDTLSPLWPKHSGQHRSVVYCRGRREGGASLRGCQDSGDCTQKNDVSNWNCSFWCAGRLRNMLPNLNSMRFAQCLRCSTMVIRVGWVFNEWVRQAHQGPKSYTTSGSRALQRSADRWEWKWAGRELILIWLAQLIQSLHSPVYMQTHFYTRFT